MIAVDLDGTLLDDDENISPYTVTILEKCKQAGIKIVIATGRSRTAAENIIDLIKPDFSILNYGALILNENNETMYNKLLLLETLEKFDSVEKINAIEIIAKKLDISLTEIAAFGDGPNDIEMIRNCGTGIAMENAPDEVKIFATDICGNHNEDGVAKWLEEHILPLSVYDRDKKLKVLDKK